MSRRDDLKCCLLEKRYGQNRFSYRGCYIGSGSANIAGAIQSGEWSDRRWRGGRTYRRSIAWERAGASCSAPAGLLCAGACLRRRTRLPFGSRALLGWIWLAISPGTGLRLTPVLPCSGLRRYPASLTSPTASILNSRLNLRLCVTHLPLHETPILGVHQAGNSHLAQTTIRLRSLDARAFALAERDGRRPTDPIRKKVPI